MTCLLLSNSPAIISVLAADDTFTYVIPSVREILGYDPAKLLGTDAFAKIHPEDREAVWTQFSAVIQHPDKVRSTEYRYETAAGEWLWLEAPGNNRLDDPAVSGVIINMQNISERKSRERDLEVKTSASRSSPPW